MKRKLIGCPLCNDDIYKFYITIEKKTVVITATEHKDYFNEEEKKMIKKMFPNRKIVWKMKENEDHAHCYIKEVRKK